MNLSNSSENEIIRHIVSIRFPSLKKYSIRKKPGVCIQYYDKDTKKIIRCNPTLGTIFYSTQIPLSKWFSAIELIKEKKYHLKTIRQMIGVGKSSMTRIYKNVIHMDALFRSTQIPEDTIPKLTREKLKERARLKAAEKTKLWRKEKMKNPLWIDKERKRLRELMKKQRYIRFINQLVEKEYKSILLYTSFRLRGRMFNAYESKNIAPDILHESLDIMRSTYNYREKIPILSYKIVRWVLLGIIKVRIRVFVSKEIDRRYTETHSHLIGTKSFRLPSNIRRAESHRKLYWATKEDPIKYRKYLDNLNRRKRDRRAWLRVLKLTQKAPH